MPPLRSDDLLVLLAIARHRTFSAAARHLGIDHTTAARRMQSLAEALDGRLLVESPTGWDLTALGERACGAARTIESALATLGQDHSGASLRGLVRITAPEAFMAEVIAPAVVEVGRNHPEVNCELVSITRPTPLHGPSADLEIGVTHLTSRRLVSQRLTSYRLGLFASRDYLRTRGPITDLTDLSEHTPVYYVESMLVVDDLDLIDQFFPRHRGLLGATSVTAQLRLVSAGAGVGLLPVYVARGEPDLVQILESDAGATLTYWMTARPDNLRRPEVAHVADVIRRHADRLDG